MTYLAVALEAMVQDHRHAASWPQGNVLDRLGLEAFLRFQANSAQDLRQNEGRLLHGEAGADADAWTRAKGEISEAIDLFALARQKAGGIETVGILPEQSMAMQDPL